jgi:anti-sigma B factor antagonist
VDFAIAVESRDDSFVVRVDGELDMANAAAFENAVASTTDPTHVVVDLSGCTFLDSAGLRAITSALRRAEAVSIVANDPAILRVLEITALDTMTSIHASLDDALAAPG